MWKRFLRWTSELAFKLGLEETGTKLLISSLDVPLEPEKVRVLVKSDETYPSVVFEDREALAELDPDVVALWASTVTERRQTNEVN